MPELHGGHFDLSPCCVKRAHIPPGCTHATTLITALLIGIFVSVQEICPAVHPRALVDDGTGRGR
eukprot:5338782-Pyramimonas_sp.AAC.1